MLCLCIHQFERKSFIREFIFFLVVNSSDFIYFYCRILALMTRYFLYIDISFVVSTMQASNFHEHLAMMKSAPPRDSLPDNLNKCYHPSPSLPIPPQPSIVAKLRLALLPTRTPRQVHKGQYDLSLM